MNPEERKVFAQMRNDRDVDGLINILKESPDPCKRIAAIQTLAKLGEPEAVPEILEHYEDYEWCFDNHTSFYIVDSLALMGPAAVDALIAALEDERPQVVDNAVWALGKIGDDRAVEPLISILEKGNSSIQEHAVRALARIGDGRTVDALTKCLGSPSTFLANEAAYSLAIIGDSRSLEYKKDIRNYLERRYDKETVASILDTFKSGKAAGENERKREFRKLAFSAENLKDNKEHVEVLIAHLVDENPVIRNDASRALVRIGKPALQKMIKYLDQDIDTSLYVAIESLLGCMGTPAIEQLIKNLKGDDWLQVSTAIDSLAQIGDPQALKYLLPFLKNGSFPHKLSIEPGYELDLEPIIRANAISALGKIGDKSTKDSLIAVLGDPNGNVRSSATGALRMFRDENLLPYFASHLKDQDSGMTAAKAMREIGPAAVEFLIDALQDENREIRLRAAWTLNGMKDERIIKPLIACLKDEDKQIREKAYDGLLRIHSPEITEALLESLLLEKDKGILKKLCDLLEMNWEPDKSRAAAIYWVTKRRCDKCVDIGEEAVDVLIPVLQDQNTLFRKEAVIALGKIHDPRAIEPLKAILADPDKDVREAVVDALTELGVYDQSKTESSAGDEKQAGSRKVPPKIEFLLDDEVPGNIVITTLEGGYEDFLGSNDEVERYCAEVSKLGNDPNLALLMETYVTGSYLDPEPLVEECKRLLAMDSVEDWIREMTEIVLEAAEDAKETGHGLYFYFAEGIVE
ncbi:HEAT repeat domain-containing protein [Methanolobus psychrotolerans]|uniref:HEAT repeat domain-containing protein n=1 Tax=Methanolobus psychrotolerans TaxID=1874706 RepID=UPI000B91816B|nr:HEAT repeat domain-containing protein [Methanolobus psychrotolerans]